MLALFIPTGWTNDLSDEEKAKRVSDAHFEMDTNPELKYGMVPVYARDRKDLTPIVVGGGPCVCNPEPIADFFDLSDFSRTHFAYENLVC